MARPQLTTLAVPDERINSVLASGNQSVSKFEDRLRSNTGVQFGAGRTTCCQLRWSHRMKDKEADITINGQPLTFAQAMTLRVAVGVFQMHLSDTKIAQQLGPIASAYRERIEEIQNIILKA